MPTNWNGPAVQARLMELCIKRMNLATAYMQGEIRKSINIGNRRGDNPSLPGEPPHKVTGRLFRSIVTSVVASGTAILGLIGTNVIYARRLEYGFFGTDSAGRRYAQAPRPFMRPALTKFGKRAMQIFATGR